MSEVIQFKPRTYKVYVCDVCGRSFEWTSASQLYGSLGHQDLGARQFKACSNKCRKASPNLMDLEYIIGDYKCHSGGKVVNSHWDEWDNKTGRFAQ